MILEYNQYSNLYSILEKEIVFKKDLFDDIRKLQGNPIADFIIDLSTKSNLLPSEEMLIKFIDSDDKVIDFPKDVKNIDILSIDKQKPNFFKTGFLKNDKLVYQETKIGKVINALIGKFNSTEIETFVRLLITAKTSLSNEAFEIKIVDGDDILQYYMPKNYIKPNSSSELGNSCMNGNICQSFISFYTYFPDKIKLAIMVNPQGKLICRGILWKLDNGKQFLDRLYGETKISMDLMVKWGEDNGIKLISKKNNATSSDLIVTLKAKYPDWENLDYPHIDTMSFGYVDKKKQLVLVNDYLRIPTNTTFYIFDQQDGTYRESYINANGDVEGEQIDDIGD